MRGVATDARKREAVLASAKAGLSDSAIARALGLPRSTVQEIARGCRTVPNRTAALRVTCPVARCGRFLAEMSPDARGEIRVRCVRCERDVRAKMRDGHVEVWLA